MKKTFITSAIAALVLSSSAMATTKIEATFEREVPQVCYVVQGEEVEGKLTFSNEAAAPEQVEVFSNTGQVELTYKKVKVNDGNFTEQDINFSINGDVATVGDTVEVNSGVIDLAMALDQTAADFEAFTTLSATSTLIVECEDQNSNGNGNEKPDFDECDDDDFDPSSGMWCPDFWEPDTDSDK